MEVVSLKQGFMVMPFSNDAAGACYKYSIKPVCDSFGIDLKRADEIFGVNPIADDILRLINEAAVVIVDISDNNPNVFYELGLAHALKRDTTIVITGTNYSQVPFDVKHIRIIKYENSIPGKVLFEQALKQTLSAVATSPEFYRSEFNVYSTLARLDAVFRQILVYVVLLLNKRPVTFTQEVAVTHVKSGIQDGFSSVRGPELASNTHLIEFGLATVHSNTIHLTPKGQALAQQWNEQGYEVEILDSFEVEP